MNLGNPNEFTIRQLAETVLKLTDSSSILIEKPLPEDDPTQRCPDISYANETLEWQPSIELEEGLERTISYFKNVL
jgi:UDP-glucuronate decarboxylase